MNIKAEMPHPHQGTPVLSLGSDIKDAKRALILLHGRGASAEDMTGLAQEFSLPDDMLVLAPQASENVWYPQRLTAPIETNEPFLSSALLRVTEVVAMLHENGIPAEKVLIGGFSQGASLAIEFVLRNARRWGGLLAFSGGYIWPIGQPRKAVGDLQGTPVFLGCSDVDPYIPLERVNDTSAMLETMGAQLTKRIYPGMGHTINQDEIETVQKIISAL
jgi:glyoxalase family protein